MPRKQDDGDGDGAPLGEEPGEPVGLVEGAPDGVPLGVPDAPPPGVELVGAPVLGWADGLVDRLPPGVAFGLVTTGVAAVLGATPPAGPVVRTVPGAVCDEPPAVLGAPVVEDPAGAWFAVGEPANAPETSSATRPAPATATAPTATAAPARRRGFPCGGRPGCPGPGGPVGRDMRGGTSHSSETYAWP
jgi:hypothetical protein